VLDGELQLDIEDRDTVTLGKYVGFTVHRGVVHRTRANVKTVTPPTASGDGATDVANHALPRSSPLPAPATALSEREFRRAA
jgi:hypothetical protein